MSSLNPYASSYIPLSERGKYDQMKCLKTNPVDSEAYDKNALTKSSSESYEEARQNQLPGTEAEVDLAYLAVMFPGVSDSSLAYVYHTTGGDVDASVDMLNQLELPAEFYHQLPDTLDTEYESPAEGASVMLKRAITDEASASSSSVALK